MKEVMSYYTKPDLATFFEGRFQYEMDKLRAYEFDRARGTTQHAAVQTGQTASVFRRGEVESYLDIRGSG